MTKDPKIPEPVSTPMGVEDQDVTMNDAPLEEFLEYFEKVEAEALAGE